MEKSIQVKVGNKTVVRQSHVIASLPLAETKPDPAFLNWLVRQEITREKGLAARRVGGIALLVFGVPLGIFAVLCFPGLFFWLLGVVALGMIGKGILLTFSNRSKSPEEAYRNLFKEAFFRADGTTVEFNAQLFRAPEAVKKRIHAMRPIDKLQINDHELAAFMNAFEHQVRAAFSYYGGQEQGTPCYGVVVDPTVTILERQGALVRAQGMVTVVREYGDQLQAVEVPFALYLIDLDGYQMPVNLVPHVIAQLLGPKPAHSMAQTSEQGSAVTPATPSWPAPSPAQALPASPASPSWPAPKGIHPHAPAPQVAPSSGGQAPPFQGKHARTTEQV